jgi:cytosine/adenosine deaminase-related metal-dependent hydrolase
VALGTDGIGANMFEEFKFAFFKHQDAHGPLGPADFVQLLANGNRLLSRYFGEQFGRLEPGYKADLVIADYLSPTELSADNIDGHMVFGMGSADVRTVLIDGQIVMEDREFPFDTEEVYAKSREAARKMWSRVDELKG